MSCPDHPVTWRLCLVALSLIVVSCEAQAPPSDLMSDTEASRSANAGDERVPPTPDVSPPGEVEADAGSDVDEPAEAEADDALADATPDPPVSDAGESGATDAIAPGDTSLEELPGPPADLPEGKAVSACSVDSECGGCAGSGSCVNGRCSYPADLCVIDDLEGPYATCYAPEEPAPNSTCLHCRPSTATDHWSGAWVAANFEQSLAPFTWVQTFGAPEATWNTSELRAYRGLQSARFGNPDSDDYVSSGRSWARMTTGPMQSVDGVKGTLRFWLWLQTEEMPGYDVLTVSLITGDSEELLWSSEEMAGTTEGEWRFVELAIEGPPNVPTRLAIEFDTGDAIINGFEGPFLDEIHLSTNCCLSDAECISGNACVTGTCGDEGQCFWEAVWGCCYEAQDCPPTEVCMQATCPVPGGFCGAEPIEDCCIDGADCNDDDMCTEDLCEFPGALCEFRPLCCTDDATCEAGDPCLQGTCEGHECVYVDRCCEDDSDCDDGNPCTTSTCFDQLCLTKVLAIEGCCIEDIFVEDFDSGLGLAGWSFQGIVGGVGWSVATPSLSSVPSKPGVLYYGNPENWNYNSGGTNDGKVWTPYLTLPVQTEITLSFDLYMDVKAGKAADLFTVLIHGPSGWEEIIEKEDVLVGQWHTVSIDISALAGYDIQMAFEFKTMTPLQNNGLGVLIDNLKLTTGCAPRLCEVDTDCPSTDGCLTGTCAEGICTYADICCQSDSACDDDNPCTTDTCVNQKCENVSQMNCCASSDDCDDDDVCTLDVCTSYGGTCFFPEIDGCCHNSGECDDDDACTVDQCLDNVCANANICCDNDAECDDGDDICTVDECVDGHCVYAPTGLDGCCLSTPIFWDFESPVSFDFTATQPPCQWHQMAAGKASSGVQTLYYGDPNTMTYACEHNAGKATSAEITLMPSVTYTLIFDANLDVESNTVYDTLDLYAIVEGKEIHLWDKSAMVSTDVWSSYTVDLSAFAGKTLQLMFLFDTHDSIANDSSGVYIDDIQITSTCLPKPCVDDLGCDDGVPQTNQSCGLSGCEYVIP